MGGLSGAGSRSSPFLSKVWGVGFCLQCNAECVGACEISFTEGWFIVGRRDARCLACPLSGIPQLR